MQYATISYSGLNLDTFLGDSGKCYVTLTSAANGLGISRQNIKDWVKNHCNTEGVPVKVGVRKSMATAYPISTLRDFLEYRVSLGDKQAAALVFSTFEADIERSIKEANGVQVTATQHEESRHSKRLAYLEQWVQDNYKPVVAKDGTINVLKGHTIREAGLDKNPTEYIIVNHLAQIAKKELWMKTAKLTQEELEMYREGNRRYQADVQKLSLSLA